MPPSLRTWLLANQHAWAGWPAGLSCDPREDRKRVARLEAAGCPPWLARRHQAIVQGIADIRLARRERLRRQVAQIGALEN